jgi:NAD(P)H dehydrogenase (quinone)
MSTHLIIKALHRDGNFLTNGVNHLISKLEKEGQKIELRDLYEMNFNPVLTAKDFELLRSGNLPDEIAHEQQYINEADYIWVVFPIWWTSMPAILKGYIDRVFLSGFAYYMDKDTPVGKLKGKKVILLNSMGMSYDEYKSSGIFDAMRLTIDKGIFEFVGMEVIAHRYFTSIMSATDDKRSLYYDDIEALVDCLLNKNNGKKNHKCEHTEFQINE